MHETSPNPESHNSQNHPQKSLQESVSYWLKTVALFIGQTLLIILGLLNITLSLYEQFEGDFSFLEISTLEFVFYLAFFWLCQRHYHLCRTANLNLRSTLYRPLRNMGWIIFLLFLFYMGYAITLDNIENIDYRFQNLEQLASMAIILSCIYWASPKLENMGIDSAKVAAKENE